MPTAAPMIPHSLIGVSKHPRPCHAFSASQRSRGTRRRNSQYPRPATRYQDRGSSILSSALLIASIMFIFCVTTVMFFVAPSRGRIWLLVLREPAQPVLSGARADVRTRRRTSVQTAGASRGREFRWPFSSFWFFLNELSQFGSHAPHAALRSTRQCGSDAV